MDHSCMDFEMTSQIANDSKTTTTARSIRDEMVHQPFAYFHSTRLHLRSTFKWLLTSMCINMCFQSTWASEAFVTNITLISTLVDAFTVRVVGVVKH